MKKLSVQEFILNEVTEYIKANMFPLRNRYVPFEKQICSPYSSREYA